MPCAKGFFAHGKAFTVCCTRQTAHGKQASIKRSFAVCHLSGTRQRVYRVLKSIRQRSFRKLISKIENKKDVLREGPHWLATQVPSKLQFVTFFAHHGPTRFKLTTSPSRVTFSTTTQHSHLCLHSIFFPHILY